QEHVSRLCVRGSSRYATQLKAAPSADRLDLFQIVADAVVLDSHLQTDAINVAGPEDSQSLSRYAVVADELFGRLFDDLSAQGCEVTFYRFLTAIAVVDVCDAADLDSVV